MFRRTFLQNGLLCGVSVVAGNLAFGTNTVLARTVGKKDGLEIVTISDGNLRLPVDFLFPEVPRDELTELLKSQLVEDGIVEPDLNVTLVRNGDRTILFDVGSGPNFMPSAGKLIDSLDAVDVSPEDVTDVIFTHGHPDHLWGILDDFDDLLFSEAQLHFPQAEFEFWMDDDTVGNMPESRQSFAVGAKNRLEAVEEQITLINGGDEVVPGVEAMGTHGHTPGHMSYVIHGLDEPVMVIGDALTNHIISFQKPEWPSGSDQDADQGIKTRQLLLDRLTNDRMKLIGYHLPDEGVGYVEKAEKAYRFVSA